MVISDASASASLDDLVQGAGFIFIGTVQQLRAATMDAVTETARAAIVKVEALVESPDSLRLYEGRELTLLQREPGGLAVGKRAVFFTRGWFYGATVAVQEVGNREVQGPTRRCAHRFAQRSRGSRRQTRAASSRGEADCARARPECDSAGSRAFAAAARGAMVGGDLGLRGGGTRRASRATDRRFVPRERRSALAHSADVSCRPRRNLDPARGGSRGRRPGGLHGPQSSRFSPSRRTETDPAAVGCS
jgi:hypothetical protein